MEKAVLPFEEQISLEQWKREGEEFTNHELHDLAKTIRLNPESAEKAVLFQYNFIRGIKYAKSFFYFLSVLFITYLISLPSLSIGAAENLEKICAANTGTVLARPEVLIGAVTLRFLVWILSIHAFDVVLLTAGFSNVVLEEAFEVLFAFPLFLWTSFALYLLPIPVCEALVSPLGPIWNFSPLTPFFNDASAILAKVPLIGEYFIEKPDWWLYVTLVLVVFYATKILSLVLRWASKNVVSGVVSAIAIAMALNNNQHSAHYVALVILAGSFLENVWSLPKRNPKHTETEEYWESGSSSSSD